MPRKVTFRDPNMQSALPDPAHQDEFTSSGPAYRFEINVPELGRLILARRRLLACITVGVTLITAVYMFLMPNLYTSTASILPSGMTDDFSAIRSLVGFEGPRSSYDENSSAMFPVILSSDLIVDSVARTAYTFMHKERERTMTLADYLGIDNPDRLRRAVQAITSVTADQRTGEIYVGVETKYPELSQAVVGNYLARLEDFNLYKRRSQARDNERYLARQVEAVKGELQAAEDSLEAFQMTNLDWAGSGSPEILKELGRWQREVDAKSATYTMLVREHEMAKLDAQKDVPIVRLLDAPSLPTMKSGPFRRTIILLSGMASFFLAVFALIVWHLVHQVQTGPQKDDYDALRRDITQAFPRAGKLANRIKTSIATKIPV